MYCFFFINKIFFFSVNCYHYAMAFNTIEQVSDLPVVQLYPVQPAEHHLSVCRHLSGLQLGEHTRKQFVPKYYSLQATGQNNI